MTKPLTGAGGQQVGKLAAFTQGPFHAGANHFIYAVLCYP